jgi:putative hydrolase of the HAD superfamily
MATELVVAGRGAIAVVSEFRRQHELARTTPEAHVVAPDQSPYEAQLARTATVLGVGVAEVERTVGEWMQERPAKWLKVFRRRSLLVELARFRAAGGKTALVSDYPARRKLEALGAVPLFDVVVANGESAAVRALKPDPAGYREAARRLGVSPAECVIIGDRADADGAAARALGIHFRRVR